MNAYKAIELDPATRQRTGREYALEAVTRQAAIDALLELVGATPEHARVDPTRTLVEVGAQLWTIVARPTSAPPADEAASLRRAGAKHRRVR